MRIIIHFNDLTGKVKGSDRSRLELATRLAERHRVIALANRVGSEAFPFQVVQMPGPNYCAALHYYRAEIELAPDVVITKSYFHHAPSLAITHAGDPEQMFAEDRLWKGEAEWRLSQKTITQTLLNAETVVARSAKIARDLKNSLGIDCRVIPNGVDTSFFHPVGKARDDRRVLMVGTLSPRKGVDILPKIIAGTPELTWAICGDGPLKELLRGLPNVTLLGWLRREQLVAEYSRARLLVVPSRYDPFPLVVLEGMACNLPVVISPGVDVGSLVDDGVGAVVPSFEPEDFVRTIRRCLNTDYSERPRQQSLFYDWSNIARQYEDLLMELSQYSEGQKLVKKK